MIGNNQEIIDALQRLKRSHRDEEESSDDEDDLEDASVSNLTWVA
jgi:hypothetical protein